MHWASVLGDSQLVECLLQYGAAAAGSSGMVTVCSTRGLSALHCAASVGSVAVCVCVCVCVYECVCTCVSVCVS